MRHTKYKAKLAITNAYLPVSQADVTSVQESKIDPLTAVL